MPRYKEYSYGIDGYIPDSNFRMRDPRRQRIGTNKRPWHRNGENNISTMLIFLMERMGIIISVQPESGLNMRNRI